MTILSEHIKKNTPSRLAKTPEYYLLLALVDHHAITTKSALTQHLNERIAAATTKLTSYHSPALSRHKQQVKHELQVLHTLQKFIPAIN